MTDLPHETASPQFLEAAQRLAELMGEDTVKVARGAMLTHRGITFSLKHHGPLDPAGLVLAIELGPLPESDRAKACEALLRRNFDAPAAIAGYYAIPPDRDAIVQCMRIDLDHEPDPVGKAAFVLEQMADTREVVSEVMERAAEKARPGGKTPIDAV